MKNTALKRSYQCYADTSLLVSKRGSASLIALLLTGAMSIMMLTMLERIIPASKNTKGIENSTSAVYAALSGVEKSLATMNINNPGHEKSGTKNNSIDVLNTSGKSTGSGKLVETVAIIPEPGKGNSDFDKNWNKISPGKPIQIYVPPSLISNSTQLSDMKIDFRVPKLGSNDSAAGNSSATQFDSTFTGTVVNLSITNTAKTLVPNYKCSTAGCKGIPGSSINNPTGISIGELQAQILEGSFLTGSTTISNLVQTTADSPGKIGCNNGCMLKLFIVNRIRTEAGQELPYLEYRIRKNHPGNEAATQCTREYSSATYIQDCVENFGMKDASGYPILPAQYARIEGIGRIGQFQQSFDRTIQQITTGDAFDFTVVR